MRCDVVEVIHSFFKPISGLAFSGGSKRLDSEVFTYFGTTTHKTRIRALQSV